MTDSPRIPPREQAEAVWRAGVRAVDSERLTANAVQRDGNALRICGHAIDLATTGKLVVVGAGKAGAGMAAAFERAVGDDFDAKLSGWVNVPADCVRPLRRIHLHAARPAGVNEPCEEGVEGSRRILELVGSLTPRDVCVVLLSGGGSALLPAPAADVGLANKQAVTRFLMHAGATINELNCVRKQLSEIKGGRLARACTAGRLIALIISDVIGDPLDVIASGPTVDDPATPADALAVLARYGVGGQESGVRSQEPEVTDGPVAEVVRLRSSIDKRPNSHESGDRSALESVTRYLRHVASPADAGSVGHGGGGHGSGGHATVVHNHVIGNNGAALRAAADEAARRGFHVHSLGSDNAGEARTVGVELAELALAVRRGGGPVTAPACILSGGEPVVHLADTHRPRKGGRNQELVLAALNRLWDAGLEGIAILSGGTDGEDGPTDAAGAVADAAVLSRARSAGLQPPEFLAINNSYPFFAHTGGLLKTGPTHTNVMDLRVVIVEDLQIS